MSCQPIHPPSLTVVVDAYLLLTPTVLHSVTFVNDYRNEQMNAENFVGSIVNKYRGWEPQLRSTRVQFRMQPVLHRPN